MKQKFLGIFLVVVFILESMLPVYAVDETSSDILVLDKPTIETVNVSGSEVELTWNAVENATEYTVERKLGSTGTYSQIATVTENTFKETGLELNTVYYYRVRAFNGNVASEYPPGKYVKTDYLEKVTVLEAESVPAGVTLQWNAVENADGYIIYYNADSLSKIAMVDADNLSYTDKAVAANSTYSYTVRAYCIVEDAYKYGGYADPVTVFATGLLELSDPVIESTKALGSQITITWSEIESAQGYILERKKGSSGTYAVVSDCKGNTYTDTGLELGTVYYYRVKAYNGDVLSNYTPGKYVKTDYLNQIVNFKVQDRADGNALIWDAVDNAQKYIVYLVADNVYTKIATVSETQYVDKNVEVGADYTYAIRAFYVEGTSYRYSPYSENITVTVEAKLVTPTITNIQSMGKTVELQWEAVNGADGYEIERREGEDGSYEFIADISETSFSETLELNTVYYYRVRAYQYEQSTKYHSAYTSGKYVKTSYLNTPENLNVSISGIVATLSWDGIEGATGYQIGSLENGEYVKIRQSTEKTVTIYDLKPDTTYTFAVRAYFETDEGDYKLSEYSDSVTATTISTEGNQFNVVDFGADGTDLDADSTAIQNALDMAKVVEGEITVIVPAGTYYLDSCLIVYSDTNFQLDEGATIVRNNPTLFMLINGDKSGIKDGGYSQFSNISISGGTWDGNVGDGAILRGIMYFAHGSNLNLNNFTIQNVCGTHHTELVGVKDATISNVTFKNFVFADDVDYSAILPDASNFSDIEYMEYDGNSAEALQLDYCSSETSNGAEPFDYTPCANIMVSGCLFENVLNGVGNHHGDAVSNNISVTGNTFSNIYNSCINLDATTEFDISNNTAKDVRSFGNLYSSTGTISNNNVTASTDGTKSAGNLVLITLFSAGSELAPTSNVSVTNNVLNNAGLNAVRIKAGATAQVINNNISDAGENGVYSENNTSVQIKENEIRGCGQYAIYAHQSDNLLIDTNTVLENQSSGILVSGGNSTISNNIVKDSKNNGIALMYVSSAMVSGNIVMNQVNNGISGKNGVATIINNEVSENSGNGIYVENMQSGTSVTENNVNKNKASGIALSGGSVALSKNNVLNNSNTKEAENPAIGIWLFASANATIDECNILDNEGDGISVQGNSTVNISNSLIQRNGKNGINVNASNAEISNNKSVQNGENDTTCYDIVFKSESNGSATDNITGIRSIYIYPTVKEKVHSENNLITLEYDYQISGLESKYYYEGEVIEPSIKISGLTEGKDFTVTYEKQNGVGTAIVYAEGIGAYTGKISATYEILQSDLERIILTSEIISGNHLVLKWNQSSDYTNYYVMCRVPDSTSFEVVDTIDATSYEFDLDYNSEYKFRVQGYSVSEDETMVTGGYSNEITACAELTVPTIENTSSCGSTITIEWSAVDGAEGYYLERKTGSSGTYRAVATVSGTSYTDSSLELNTVYYYRVRAYSGETKGKYTAGKYTKTDCLEQVKNLTAAGSTDGIVLNWDAVEGADGYLVYDAENTSAKIAMVKSGTTYTDKSVEQGASRSYTVRGYYVIDSSYKYGAYADVASATMPKVELGMPAIESTSSCGSVITIEWSAVDGAEGYYLERKTGSSGTYRAVATVSGTSYTDDSGLELNTVYYYRVRAYSGETKGKYTAGKYTKTDCLEQVKNLTATGSTDGIVLNWDAVEGADGYLVYDAENTSAKIAMVKSGTTYTDKSVEQGASRSYTVRGYYVIDSSYKYGAYADVASATMPKVELGMPTIENTSSCGSVITIEWSAVDGAEGYYLERKTGSSGTYRAVATVSGTSYTDDSGLELNTVYYYRVRAYSGETKGKYTAGKYTKTDCLEQVKNLTATGSADGIVLNWDAVEGADGYLVYDAENTSAKIAMVKSGTTYTDKSVEPGASRSYTVRAYYVIDSSYKYGAYADAASATMLEQ